VHGSMSFEFFQLAVGRECVEHYAEQRRFCVFSHDELICKMAAKVSRMSVPMALAVCKDMTDMYKAEIALRKDVTNNVGVFFACICQTNRVKIC
jgi:hypothetical protein